MNKSSFFIIGAQRSGTTYLYDQLDAHPEIYMAKPRSPEPKFFIDENSLSLGKEYYLDKFFSRANNESVLGEKSTSYIEYPKTGVRILKFFPDAKFIIVLRNPVNRALSNYFFTKKNGLETRSLEEVFIKKTNKLVEKEQISVSPYDYLRRGDYLPFIQNYVKSVGSNRIRILLFEEMVENFKKIQELYADFGIDSNFIAPNHSKKVNIGGISEDMPDQLLNKLRVHFAPLNQKLKTEFSLDLSYWDK